jgi:cytochrome c5
MYRVAAALLFLACSPRPPPPPPDGGARVCDVVAPTSCADAGVRYSDVKQVFVTHCETCHYGAAGGPWPLTSYQDVAD